MTELFQPLINRYMIHITYWSVTALMAIESSFIPFPSEIIIPPAAWKVAQGMLNWWLVFFFAGIWALIWALFNYYIALWLGRKIIYKLADTKRAHMIFITKESLQKSEEYFRAHGKTSTLIGRLIPAIRQLISLPAGLAKMNIFQFIWYTLLWASLRNAVLFIAWYLLGQHWDKIKEYNHIFTQIVFWLIWLVILYFVLRYFVRKKSK